MKPTQYDALIKSYDQLPYESNPFFESHPARLATIAHLAGLDPPRPETCRVLELGCAAGGNLIPAAESLPDASFIGIDLAPNQIAAGRAIIEALNVTNVRLEAMDVAGIAADFGEFDYIIAHGLYSWVPAAMQQCIMEICQRHLAPCGIAYISYNTHPGWKIRGAMRDMLFYGIEDQPAETAQARLAAARDFAQVIRAGAGDHESDYTRLLRGEVDMILGSADAYVAHDHLEPYAEPVYFHEFAARAADHGLTYIADAKFNKAIYRVEARLKDARPGLSADPIRLEQCIDFAYGRQFRRSVLCRTGQTIQREFVASRLRDCHLAATVFPSGPVDPRPNVNATFEDSDGGTFTTADPGMKAALAFLAQAHPLPVSYGDLWEKVRLALRLPRQHPAFDQMAGPLLSLFVSDSVEPHLLPPAFVTHVSDRPMASPLARYQAAAGHVVHNRRHRAVRSLSAADRSVLARLDGTLDVAALGNDAAVRESLRRLAMNAVLIA